MLHGAEPIATHLATVEGEGAKARARLHFSAPLHASERIDNAP